MNKILITLLSFTFATVGMCDETVNYDTPPAEEQEASCKCPAVLAAKGDAALTSLDFAGAESYYTQALALFGNVDPSDKETFNAAIFLRWKLLGIYGCMQQFEKGNEHIEFIVANDEDFLHVVEFLEAGLEKDLEFETEEFVTLIVDYFGKFFDPVQWEGGIRDQMQMVAEEVMAGVVESGMLELLQKFEDEN
ncbi:MAG: hypothetical protein S4CHLAM102_07250 [Chlamydiia bacterium]|nr:hypothetical protein [Chlamydiia bacterium]